MSALSRTRYAIARVCCAILGALVIAAPLHGEELVVGSKRFTESYILGEIAAQVARAAGEPRVSHKQGLGNTAILFEALKNGSVHLYPDYTGTIGRELLKTESTDLDVLNAGLAKFGLGVALRLGFENTYAIALREEDARTLQVRRLSDLIDHRDLKLGLSHEFLKRDDGWPGLRRAYALPQAPVGLDHGLAYEAMASRQIDGMDIYSTDAKIARYHLRVLQDDRKFFPEYQAVFIYRLDVPAKFPKAWAALSRLTGRIDAARMIEMNAAAEITGLSFGKIAEDFLATHPDITLPGSRTPDNSTAQPDPTVDPSVAPPSGQQPGTREPGAHLREAHNGEARGGTFLQVLLGADLLRLTLQHVMLVAGSLLAAIFIGIPLGVVAARVPWTTQPILTLTGVIQTVPSLALLAILIPVVGGIGLWPALIALFLYALLPIVRNTHSGLTGISDTLRESACALGLSDWARLKSIELPLAAGTILAGIKTSAVINVGTATIAAFIGAGGYGERIVTGLALNDHTMLLAGALPAALLALLTQWGFDAVERAR